MIVVQVHEYKPRPMPSPVRVAMETATKVMFAFASVDRSAGQSDVGEESSDDDLVESALDGATDRCHAENSDSCSTPAGLVRGSSTSDSESPPSIRVSMSS